MSHSRSKHTKRNEGVHYRRPEPPRTDCPDHPEKRAYTSQGQALRAAQSRVADVCLSAYRCRGCGRWHLTSQYARRAMP